MNNVITRKILIDLEYGKSLFVKVKRPTIIKRLWGGRFKPSKGKPHRFPRAGHIGLGFLVSLFVCNALAEQIVTSPMEARSEPAIERKSEHSSQHSSQHSSLNSEDETAAYSAENEYVEVLELEQAIASAIALDPWLTSSQFKERAMMAQSEASLALPDPVISLSISNVPTNGLSLNQEPMTQLQAGVSQMLPRGNSRQLQSEYQKALALEQPLLRSQRNAESAVQVTALWLEAYKAKASTELMQENAILLNQLGDIANANYASALGSTRQQDVIDANIETYKIKDSLIQLNAQKIAAFQRLRQWLQADQSAHAFSEQTEKHSLTENSINIRAFRLPKGLPDLRPIRADILHALQGNKRQVLANMLSTHPTIGALEQRINASSSAISLAKQKYKPQWGVNASYAYRHDDKFGASRADFLSIGISFDLPLYTSQKQDNEVSASIYESESLKTDKRLALRQIVSQLLATYALHTQLQARFDLYTTHIVPQTTQQAQTVLSAFTHNEAKVFDVLKAQIAQQNAQLDLLNIEIEQHKVRSQLNYYLHASQNEAL